jgi:hypothetical protein
MIKQSRHTSRRDGVLLSVGFSLRCRAVRRSLRCLAVGDSLRCLAVGDSLRCHTAQRTLRCLTTHLALPRSRSEHSYVGSTLSVLYARVYAYANQINHPVRDVIWVETNDTDANPACRRYATLGQSGRIPNGMRGSTVRILSTHIASLTGWGEPVNRAIFRRALPYADVCKGFALLGNRKLATGTNDDAITAAQYPFACYAGTDLHGIPFFTVALGYCLHGCARYASADTPHTSSHTSLTINH